MQKGHKAVRSGESAGQRVDARPLKNTSQSPGGVSLTHSPNTDMHRPSPSAEGFSCPVQTIPLAYVRADSGAASLSSPPPNRAQACDISALNCSPLALRRGGRGRFLIHSTVKSCTDARPNRRRGARMQARRLSTSTACGEASGGLGAR